MDEAAEQYVSAVSNGFTPFLLRFLLVLFNNWRLQESPPRRQVALL